MEKLTRSQFNKIANALALHFGLVNEEAFRPSSFQPKTAWKCADIPGRAAIRAAIRKIRAVL